MGTMLFDLTAGKGYFYDNADFVANARGLVCQPIVISPKISSLLAWACACPPPPPPLPPLVLVLSLTSLRYRVRSRL
jgi:hypothetical protein